MAQIFTGTFLRSIDAKNRVLIPSEIRDALDADDRRGLFLIPGKECVFLWPHSYLDRYAKEKSADPFGNLTFNRAFYSQAIFKSFDGTGRIVFPGNLVERFPKREALVVGAGLYLEAWDPAAWEEKAPQLEL